MKLNDIVVVTETSNPNRKCKSFNQSTDQCTTGCKAKSVPRLNTCPYDVEDQHECPCFK
jgi:hypothetical protein